MKRIDAPNPPSTHPADYFQIRPHVQREIDIRLKEKRTVGYRDPGRPDPQLTPTEKVQVSAALTVARYPDLDRPSYSLDLAREKAKMIQIVAAPVIDLPSADALDALRQPEGRDLWRNWRDPFARSDKLPAVAAAKTLAVMMVAKAKVYVNAAFDDLRDSVEIQQRFDVLEREVNSDAV